MYANTQMCLCVFVCVCVCVCVCVLKVCVLYLYTYVSYKHAHIYVVIKPEFSKFPKKIKEWSLSSSRCKFSVSVDFVS